MLEVEGVHIVMLKDHNIIPKKFIPIKARFNSSIFFHNYL